MKKKQVPAIQSDRAAASLYVAHSPQAAFASYGRHLLLNFADCQVDLNDLSGIREDMITATSAVGATIIGELAHRFQPQGVSVILMLSESHASVHTYPEYGSCFLDIFTCGADLRVELFGETLERLWRPGQVTRQLVERVDPLKRGLVDTE